MPRQKRLAVTVENAPRPLLSKPQPSEPTPPRPMVRNRSEEEERVQAACNAWESGRFISMVAAARSVGANYARLRNRVADPNPNKPRYHEEQALLRWCNTLEVPVSWKMVENKVNSLLALRKRSYGKERWECEEQWAKTTPFSASRDFTNGREYTWEDR